MKGTLIGQESNAARELRTEASRKIREVIAALDSKNKKVK